MPCARPSPAPNDGALESSAAIAIRKASSRARGPYSGIESEARYGLRHRVPSIRPAAQRQQIVVGPVAEAFPVGLPPFGVQPDVVGVFQSIRTEEKLPPAP